MWKNQKVLQKLSQNFMSNLGGGKEKMVAFVKGKFPVTQHVTVGNKTCFQQLHMPQTTVHKILQNILRFKSFKTVLVVSLSRVTTILQCGEGTIYK
jgi:hypothetical protein